MLLTELYAQEQLDQVILDVFSDLNNYMILWFYVDIFRSNRQSHWEPAQANHFHLIIFDLQEIMY